VDVVARIVSEGMSERLGGRLVIESQTGASGMVGMRAGVRAAPDGYTPLAVDDAVLTMLPNLSADVGYDPLRDFAPIGRIVRIRWAPVANPNAPARDVAGLVAQARARPGGDRRRLRRRRQPAAHRDGDAPPGRRHPHGVDGRVRPPRFKPAPSSATLGR